MKQITCLLLPLCLFFSAKAQQGVPIKQSSTDTAGALRSRVHAGDPVPDVTISGIAGLSLNGKPVTTARISDFRGKLLILDFWATWCAPCRSMVPVMDSLRRVFGEGLVFLPVTYESSAVVGPVLAQMRRVRGFDLPEVTGDTVLHGLFPHRSLPHYVWIDPNGKLRAVTEFGEVTGAHIRRVLSGATTQLGMEEKRDVRVAYDKGRPLLVGGNGGDGASLVYHSLLTGYTEGIGGGLNISPLDSVRGQLFTVRNVPMIWLGRLAFGDHGRWFPDARVVFETRDSLRMTTKLSGQAYVRWLKAGNGWCYELALPPGMARDPFRLIREDLERLFPAYRIGVERREVRSLVLVRTSAVDKLRSAGGTALVDIGPYACHLHNGTIGQLMMRLERQYLQGSALPLADGTGYTGKVDLDFEAPLSDLKALNAALARYGLAFIEKIYPAELLVFRDNL